MDSGGNSPSPLGRRQSNKSTAGIMPLHSRTASLYSPPPPYLLPPHPYPHQHDEQYDNEHDTRRRRIHYPGDGYDFRRPAMSTSASSESNRTYARAAQTPVIDLTDADDEEESQGMRSQAEASRRATPGPSRADRLPRFRHPVIDIESSGEEERDHHGSNRPSTSNYLAPPTAQQRPQYSSLRRPTRQPTPRADMDEVEFLSAQPAQPRMPPPVRLGMPHRYRSATPYPRNEPIDLTDDNDDELMHMNTRRAHVGVNADRPEAPAGIGAFGIGRVQQMLGERGMLGGRIAQRLANLAGWETALGAQQHAHEHFNHDSNSNHHPNIYHHQGNVNRARVVMAEDPLGEAYRMAVNMPGIMDYETTGFDMGLGGNRNRNRQPSPKYEPPPAPADGFTRSPTEDEEVVCPNCGDELAIGAGDLKQEVWVVKACGHAYCGLCAHNRSRSTSKKGKGKAPARDDGNLPPPFKKCVVEGCGKSTITKSMIRIYFGGD